MTQSTAAVVGQFARDLVLSVDRLPESGSSGAATGRREQLGGKGANQAVALAQLGVRPALVAVAGNDLIGDELLAQARRDGVDVRAVVRRPGVLTSLIVEILVAGEYRYVEDLLLLTEADVLSARAAIEASDAVLVQLQQPVAAAVAAARIGHEAGRLVVLDGQITDRRLLALADVVRADEKEADGLDERILDQGPSLLAIARPSGNLLIWSGGRVELSLTGGDPVDTTGGGDSFVAGLTAALLRGASYEEAGRLATAASGSTVGHPGGRPDLRDV
ncbi:PfkB family carbohydrate kinase [Actinoplanes sp. NPDC051633]|uniref:PfkB family carbohydrate kinase n=1 Tax=Actinoplanes sp. NPDC051633 TaxID=3155670 RepID=UPI003423B75A